MSYVNAGLLVIFMEVFRRYFLRRSFSLDSVLVFFGSTFV